jgi:hypothetical protein
MTTTVVVVAEVIMEQVDLEAIESMHLHFRAQEAILVLVVEHFSMISSTIEYTWVVVVVPVMVIIF